MVEESPLVCYDNREMSDNIGYSNAIEPSTGASATKKIGGKRPPSFTGTSRCQRQKLPTNSTAASTGAPAASTSTSTAAKKKTTASAASSSTVTTATASTAAKKKTTGYTAAKKKATVSGSAAASTSTAAKKKASTSTAAKKKATGSTTTKKKASASTAAKKKATGSTAVKKKATGSAAASSASTTAKKKATGIIAKQVVRGESASEDDIDESLHFDTLPKWTEVDQHEEQFRRYFGENADQEWSNGENRSGRYDMLKKARQECLIKMIQKDWTSLSVQRNAQNDFSPFSDLDHDDVVTQSMSTISFGNKTMHSSFGLSLRMRGCPCVLSYIRGQLTGIFVVYQHSLLWTHLRLSVSGNHSRALSVNPTSRGVQHEAYAAPGVGKALMKDVLKQILEAAAFLHESGVVHRDIKPSNIMCETNLEWDETQVMIPEDYRVKCRLGDFSWAWSNQTQHLYTGGPTQLGHMDEYAPPDTGPHHVTHTSTK